MNSIDPVYGSFAVQFKLFGEPGVVTIHPEMLSARHGISPSGKYHIYCVHPFHGSHIFIVEQDDNGVWISQTHPSFVSVNFIAWIGQQIEIND